MKFNLPLVLLAFQAPSALSAAASAAAAECEGMGGVMKVPEGADSTTVRTCKEHPLTPSDGAPSYPNHPDDTQKFYFAAPDGCDNKYCWKACGSDGDGKRCWLAYSGGTGQWTQCRSWEDCQPDNVGD
ncbi:uncharacterized protein BDV17DRAFT_292924 [Aspergillus undulatus]|uniref:uncharacterized protein n=1 Tax=Aspergillus undulatus TaxID=1810928 RepID=UPI003CCCC684